MRYKLLILGIGLGLLAGCFPTLKVVKQESTVIDNPSFEAVWNAALKSVTDMGFDILEKDKNKKITLPAFSEVKAFIRAEGPKNLLKHLRRPQLQITIQNKNGRVHVDCQAVQPGQMLDYGESEKNVRRFFGLLKENLDR